MGTVAENWELRGFAAAVISGFLVASCDGAGWTGLITRNKSPAGIYSGIFFSTAASRPESRMVTGIVSEDSEIHLIVQPTVSFSQYGGMVSVDGDALTGTMTEYLGARARWFGFDGVRSITLEGTVSERERLFGDYSGDDQGTFGLDYSDKYDRPSALDQVSGIWTFDLGSSGGGVYNVTFDTDPIGQLFGTDTNGCIYSGEFEIVDSRFNAYAVSVTVSSCQPVEGGYTGLAFRDSFQGIERLWLFFDNGRYAFSTTLSQ